MSLQFKTSSFSVYLDPPVFKKEILSFLESDRQGQVKLNQTCVIKRVAREIGDYYREPCPIILSVPNVDIVLTDENLVALKKLLSTFTPMSSTQ